MGRFIVLIAIALTAGAAISPSVQPGAAAARDVRLVDDGTSHHTTPRRAMRHRGSGSFPQA